MKTKKTAEYELPELDQDVMKTTINTGFRDIWRLAWPSILSNLLMPVVGLAHLIIVSDLGPNALAAVTTGHRYFFVLQAFIIALSVGASAIVANHWGGNRKDHAALVASTALIITVPISLLLSIPGLVYSNAIALALGLEGDVARQSAELIWWFSAFNLAFAANTMMSALLRACSDVISPLVFAICSTTANILTAILFVMGLLGLTSFGVAGVGIGAGIGMSIFTLLFLYLWIKGRFRLKPNQHHLFDFSQLKQLLLISFPIALEQGVIQLSFLAFMAIIALYGTSAYAAYGIGVAILSLSFVIGMAFGIASATIIGQSLGAGSRTNATRSGWRAMWLAVLIMSVFATLLAAFSTPLAALMSSDPTVIELTGNFIKMLAFAQPIMAIEFSLSGALRGAGDTKFPLFSTFIGLFFGRLLLALVFVQMELGVYWIFSVTIVDYGIKALLLVLRFRSGKWHKTT